MLTSPIVKQYSPTNIREHNNNEATSSSKLPQVKSVKNGESSIYIEEGLSGQGQSRSLKLLQPNYMGSKVEANLQNLIRVISGGYGYGTNPTSKESSFISLAETLLAETVEKQIGWQTEIKDNSLPQLERIKDMLCLYPLYVEQIPDFREKFNDFLAENRARIAPHLSPTFDFFRVLKDQPFPHSSPQVKNVCAYIIYLERLIEQSKEQLKKDDLNGISIEQDQELLNKDSLKSIRIVKKN